MIGLARFGTAVFFVLAVPRLAGAGAEVPARGKADSGAGSAGSTGSAWVALVARAE